MDSSGGLSADTRHERKLTLMKARCSQGDGFLGYLAERAVARAQYSRTERNIPRDGTAGERNETGQLIYADRQARVIPLENKWRFRYSEQHRGTISSDLSRLKNSRKRCLLEPRTARRSTNCASQKEHETFGKMLNYRRIGPARCSRIKGQTIIASNEWRETELLRTRRGIRSVASASFERSNIRNSRQPKGR